MKNKEKTMITNERYDEINDIYSSSYLELSKDKAMFIKRIDDMTERVGVIDLELVTLLEQKLFLEYAISDLTNDTRNYEKKICAYDNFIKRYSSIKSNYNELFQEGIITDEQFRQKRMDIKEKIKDTKDIYTKNIEGYKNSVAELTETEILLSEVKKKISNLEKEKKRLIENISIARQNLKSCAKNVGIVQKRENKINSRYFKDESCNVVTELKPYMKQYKKENKPKK